MQNNAVRIKNKIANVIIDWKLDNNSKLHYVEQTGAFETNNVNAIIIPTILDAIDKDIDMAFEIRNVNVDIFRSNIYYKYCCTVVYFTIRILLKYL